MIAKFEFKETVVYYSLWAKRNQFWLFQTNRVCHVFGKLKDRSLQNKNLALTLKWPLVPKGGPRDQP